MSGVVAAAKFVDMTTGHKIQKMNYSNRVVHQSERKKDKYIE